MEKTSVEDRRRRMEALREHLAEGAGQAARHDFVESFDIEDVISRAKARV
jgi:hypothetical protein